MNIKTATKIAIYTTTIGLIMSVIRPFFTDWVIQHYSHLSETRHTTTLLLNIYGISGSIIYYGGILIFLLAISQRQKGE